MRIRLKPGTGLVRQNQHPLKLESRRGLLPIIEKFIKYALLKECESKFNIPILPVKKSNRKDYSLVKDLRATNKIVADIHPVVVNPYTLLTTLSENLQWFTVLDLKDAFFCTPLSSESQELFTFKWENPNTGRKNQLTWTVLLRDFQNSSTILGNQLTKELEEWRNQNPVGALLQYVDDILTAMEMEQQFWDQTVALLNFPGQSRYTASKKKAKVVKTTLTYLGFEILKGQRRLGQKHKETICNFRSHRQ